MRIAYVGNFEYLYDEEYIARSFEMIGHTVHRIEQKQLAVDILSRLREVEVDIILFGKWDEMPSLAEFQARGIKTVCWLFDLYWGYVRENRINARYFKADYVFTTDAGHDAKFKIMGIRHQVVRQGIYKPDCYPVTLQDAYSEDMIEKVVFVGSANPANEMRNETLYYLQKTYGDDFKWYGRHDTNEMRGSALNYLYARTKVIVGDSVMSPFYWSNRVVETLGRGGFLIHCDVPGLKEEYPDIVTYEGGNFGNLKEKIDYYLQHEEERMEIVRRNFRLVASRYTMDKKCAELISKL